MKKTLVGNWKMNLSHADADSFFSSLPLAEGVDVRIAPSFTLLPQIRDHAERVGVTIGAQNINANTSGAHTGEVSAQMILEAGAKFTLIGHSERRNNYCETNQIVEKKVETAVVTGLSFILCVGESLEEHDLGRGAEVVVEQIATALSSLGVNNMKESMIAYEPVWAIGSGKIASESVIEQMHLVIRNQLVELFGEEANEIRILYGGSVTPKNLDGVLALDNVDGTLVGGASLKPESFIEMIQITGQNS